ncbi:MAG: SDR family oxidoreductase [Gemmatimonadetes bacterium]|nr:SDR family oxidoreductase [Gemmatimonadota bacterium]
MSERTLAGRVAVVSGGTRGIGRAVAERLVQAGATVLVVARDRAATEAAARELGAHAFAANVALESDVASLAAAVHDQFAAVDVVVHAAGAFELAPLLETSLKSFDRMLAVNLRGAFLLVSAFLPSMLARGAGHFVSIGSRAGRLALPGNGAYAASKFGLRGLHAVLDLELQGTGVRATLIEAAATDTGLWDGIDPRSPAVPARAGMLRPGAVADAVLFAITRAPDTAVRNIILDRN